MKTLFFTINFIFFVSALFAQEFTTGMETIFTSEHATDHLQHVKSAVDSKDVLHVVFTGHDNHLYYGTNQSGSWNVEQLGYFDTEYEESFDVVKLPNIAVDPYDNVHIVTFDRYGEKLVYGKKNANAGEFRLETVGLSPEPLRLYVYGSMGVEYSDLAADKNGGLHLICKSDYTDKTEARFQQCATYFYKPPSSAIWQLEVLIHDPQFNDRNWAYGTSSSIACYDDMVYVAIGGSNELHFGTRKISGGIWDIEKLLNTPDEVINSGKDETSLAISPNGSITFAFKDRTDAEDEPAWRGISIFSRNTCGNNEWQGYNFSTNLPITNATVGNPALAFDKNGKLYLAFGQNEYSLWHLSCDCDSKYKKIFALENQNGDIDMVVGKGNTVYTFFTSVYDNQLRLLTAKPVGSTQACNYPPSIVGHTGKTNLKPGEKWTGTITASDPECDKIFFESIIHNEIFTLQDHGDGTATITATMPEGEGKGTPGLSVWALDENHPNTNNEVSVISFNLVITPEGQEKGSIKVENKCTGGNHGKAVKGNTHSTAAEALNNTEEPALNHTEANPNTEEGSNAGCEKFLDDYQAFSERYIPVAKKVKENAMDVQAAVKLGEMMNEYASYATKWVTEYDCSDIPEYQKRFDEITGEIENSGQ